LSTLLGAIFLNRNCIVNEREEKCKQLGEARAKVFLQFMMKQYGSNFPGLNVPMNKKGDAINIYEAFFNFVGKSTDIRPGVLDVPKGNKPIGFPIDDAEVNKHNESQGFIVKQSPTLEALDGVTLTRGLFVTKQFKKGELITSIWGAYKKKVSDADSMKVIKMVQDIPKQVNVFMKIDEHCAAFYINSPPLNVKTKDIPTNCDMIETASDLSDSMKIGVFATRDIATGDELWTKYSDVSTGTNGGRKLTQQSRLAVAVKKEAVKKVASSHLPSEADQAAFLDDSAAADTGSAAGKAPAPANPATGTTGRMTRSRKRAADPGHGNATKRTKATKDEAASGEDEDEDEGEGDRTSDDYFDMISDEGDTVDTDNGSDNEDNEDDVPDFGEGGDVVA